VTSPSGDAGARAAREQGAAADGHCRGAARAVRARWEGVFTMVEGAARRRRGAAPLLPGHSRRSRCSRTSRRRWRMCGGPQSPSRTANTTLANTAPNTSTVTRTSPGEGPPPHPASPAGSPEQRERRIAPGAGGPTRPASSPRPSTIVNTPSPSSANSTSGAPAMTVRSRSFSRAARAPGVAAR